MNKYPKFSDPQRIGKIAETVFEAKCPKNWILAELSAGKDFGLDRMCQVAENGEIRHLFYAQIKGSIQKGINSTGEYFSVPINISTLNYYLSVGTSILLVYVYVADESTDTSNLNAYYLWLDEELEVLREGNDNLNHLDKKSHTFRIPTNNILNSTLDILPYLRSKEDRRFALNNLHESFDKVFESHTQVRQVMSSIADRCMENPLEEKWRLMPTESFGRKLHKISSLIGNRRYSDASDEIGQLNENEASDKHEKAEFIYQQARLAEFYGSSDSEELFKNAYETFEESKYKIVYLERKLSKPDVPKEEYRKALEKLENDNSIRSIQVKAKFYAFLKEFDNALNVLEGKPDEKIAFTKALVLLMKEDYNSCIKYVEEVLENEDISSDQNLLLKQFKARCLFYQGISNNHNEVSFIPITGLPEMNNQKIREAWVIIKECWLIIKEHDFYLEAENIIDMSFILGGYFNEPNAFYPALKTAFEKRKYITNFREDLLNFAFYMGDIETIKNQFDILPETPQIIVKKIIFYGEQNELKAAVNTAEKNLDRIIKEKPEYYQIALAVAIYSAEHLPQENENKKKFLDALEVIPNSEGIIAIYKLKNAIGGSLLEKEKVLDEAYVAFEKGNLGKEFLHILLSNIEAENPDNAQRIKKIVHRIKKHRNLGIEEVMHYLTVLFVIKDWKEVISICNESRIRFGDILELTSAQAVAYDELGYTPDALKLLKNIENINDYDFAALFNLAQILARCSLINKAARLFEKILERTNNRKEKLYLLRILLQLETFENQRSDKSFNYCQQYGNICDSNNEEEEAFYLLSLVTVTANLKSLSEDIKIATHQRIKGFFKKFPHSKIFGGITVPENASDHEIFQKIKVRVGINEESIKQLQKNENLIRSGKALMPYSMRGQLFLNISDFLHLWEVTKASNRNFPQYTLTISMPADKNIPNIENKIPLLDETALFIIYDLGLLEKIFSLFEKIAITKSTMLRLQNLGRNPFLSSNIASRIIKLLRKYIGNIQQPGDGRKSNLSPQFEDLKEYQRHLNEFPDFIFYSDDAIARHLVTGDDSKERTYCTLHTIEMLRSRDIINQREAMLCKAKLCQWNIVGIRIDYKDDMLVSIKDINFAGRNIEEITQLLEKNRNFISFINCLWNLNESLDSKLTHLADFISFLISHQREFDIRDELICELWIRCINKIKIHHAEKSKKPNYFLILSFLRITLLTDITINEHTKTSHYHEKLIGLLLKILETTCPDDLLDHLDKSMYRDISRVIMEKGNSPLKDKWYNCCVSGLKGNEEEVFNNIYQNESVKARNTLNTPNNQ